MVRTIRPNGNSCGVIIDKAVLDLLNLRAGSPVDVSLAPGAKGILSTPLGAPEVDADGGKAAHKARVRATGSSRDLQAPSGSWPNELGFLDVADVLDRHARQIETFGGSSGVRDLGLLESAIAQPSMTFGEESLHEGLFAMAAAYLFHIVKNHPFVDGTKRTGSTPRRLSSPSTGSR